MDMNNITLTISYDIHFASVPEGGEDYAELIRANVEQLFDAHSDEFISDSFDESTLNETDIRQRLEERVAAECALEASAAQNKHLQNILAELMDSCYVTVTMSDSMDNIMSKVEEEVETYITSALGGG